MKQEFNRLFLAVVGLCICLSGFSQTNTGKAEVGNTVIDSLINSGIIFNYNHKKPEIILSTDQSLRFLQQRTQPQYWIDSQNPFRLALSHLIYEASHPIYDTVKKFLERYPYDSLQIPWDKFYIWEPLRLKIPVIAPPEFHSPEDSTMKADTNAIQAINDSTRSKSLTILNQLAQKQVAGLKDTTIMVVIDTLNEVLSSVSGFPFRYYNFPYQGDSTRIAVESVMKYLEKRDSAIVNFTGVGKTVIPFWMNSKSDVMARYWLKNEFSDSVTVWIGNPARNTIGLYLEQGVNFRRPVRQGNYSKAKINVELIDNSKLHEVQKILVKLNLWKYRTETSFAFSQTALTNWVRGGENSVSTAIDITGYADYNNKALKVSSSNFARLKLGFLKTGSDPVRKNVDLLETNSKLNHKAFGKFDFSAILLFKTQIASGYSYSKVLNRDTSFLVSKFMNPAILTIGIGLDYKPNKRTSINFSPLSYKGTFILDPARIDPTTYGMPKGKRSLNEPGVSFMITNELRPFKNLAITNRFQLFTNYIKNPQNIDIDWEVIAVVNLNWFTDVRINTHLIFDDDARTVELDNNKNPVLKPDGTQKLTARTQFKEMIGLSFVFRF